MKDTTRLVINRILSILTGVIAGAIVMGLLEYGNHALYPFPEDLDFTDREAFKDFISSMPTYILIFAILAHAVGSIVGGFVASKMAKVLKRGTAIYTGLILLFAGILNMVTMPLPIWFCIIDFIVYVPMALLGNNIRAAIWK